MHAERLRDELLVAEIQQIRALNQYVGDHEDHKAVVLFHHCVRHERQKFLLALEHPL